MAFSKQYLYDPTDMITAGYAHAFGHAARILIIKQLIHLGPNAVKVIARDHPIHNESVSDHLKVLRHFDLVEWNENYPYTIYSANIEELKKACSYLSEYIEIIKSKC